MSWRIFGCVGNKEKCINFSVTIIEDVKRIVKKRKEVKPKFISYKLQFINILRFIASVLSIFFILLWKEFIKLNVNIGIILKNMKNVESNTKIVSAIVNM